MTITYLEYQLENGYIHHWLVAGPLSIDVSHPHRLDGENVETQIARLLAERHLPPLQGVVEHDTFTVGDTTLTWRYTRCQDDHFIDLTDFYPTCHYLQTCAYTQVVVPSAQEVTCVLTTNGAADLWLNGRHIHRYEHFHRQIPKRVPGVITPPAILSEGSNEIFVRFEAVAAPECSYAMALQLVQITAEDARVLLPTYAEHAGHRQLLERVMDAAYLDRDVFTRTDAVTVYWPDTLNETCGVAIRIQQPAGRIFGEAWPVAKAGNSVAVVKGSQVLEGPYQITLMPRPEEYYIANIRVQKEVPLWVIQNAYAQRPYGTYEQRRREALEDAARREGHVFCEIAKVELGQWSEVKVTVIAETIAGINRRAACSDVNLVGLLGMMHRSMDDPAFPEDLKQPLEACVLSFKYWMDEPGNDMMCYWSESHQIIFHTCEILAGQLYPERTFSNAHESGQWHREKGESMALAWLRKRARGGFQEWDSHCDFEEDTLALAHLADLAEDDQVREFAAIILDKLLFSLAINSYQGVFGSTHGSASTPMIKGGRREATAGISQLMWGMGVFNHHLLGTVSLACALDYELPSIIQKIAGDQPEELWSRERHAGVLEEWCDRASGVWEVNKVTYKTPDYMLCSAQDYQPGGYGYQQHIWQATLSADAVVFVTHPPCLSEKPSHRPNFWRGNTILPRVAQWKDVLIAVHKLPDDDWLGFTHAYFPVYAFDEHVIRDGWAFACIGDGYLALMATQGLTQITTGTNAYRELRSYGQRNIWVCHMGRATLHGDFDAFQRAILQLDVRQQEDPLTVRCATLHGETLAFGWQGPFLVNDIETPLSGFKHYDSPYCVTDLPASRMEIHFRDQLLRLNFD